MNVIKTAKMATALSFPNKESYDLFLEKHPDLAKKMALLQKEKYNEYYFNLVTDLSAMVQREFENEQIDMVKFQNFYRATDKLKKLVNEAPYEISVDSDQMDVVEDMIKRLNF